MTEPKKKDGRGPGLIRQFARLRLNYFMETLPKDIISAKYCVKDLSGFNSSIELSLYEADYIWTSTQMTWSSKIGYSKQICKKTVEKSGLIEFDITDFVKDCSRDTNGTKESAGFVIKTNSTDGYRILASHDNGLYAPYYVITLNRLPYSFDPHDEINPPIG